MQTLNFYCTRKKQWKLKKGADAPEELSEKSEDSKIHQVKESFSPFSIRRMVAKYAVSLVL
jgi:hypothetical protein